MNSETITRDEAGILVDPERPGAVEVGSVEEVTAVDKCLDVWPFLGRIEHVFVRDIHLLLNCFLHLLSGYFSFSSLTR